MMRPFIVSLSALCIGLAGPAARAQAPSNPFAQLAAPAPSPAPAPATIAPLNPATAQPPVSAPVLPAPAARPDAPATVALQRPPQADNRPVPGVALRFENAEIQDIVQAILGNVLQVNYLVDPSIQGRVTLHSAGTISAADVYNLLESVLALHGISIVRDGKVYKVIRDAQANRDAGLTAAGENSPVIQIIPLKFVQASGLIATLRAALGPQAQLGNDPTNRYLIVVDRAQNVSKIIDLVATLDVDYLAKVQMKIIALTKGDAAEVAKDMDSLFRTSGMFNLPGTDGNKVFFLPIVRLNAILVAAANPAMLTAAEKWIATLDEDPKTGLSSLVHVYPVTHSNAVHLANLLRQIYGGAPAAASTTTSSAPAATQPGQPAAASEPARVVVRGAQTGSLPGNVQIFADENTNSLVIRASQQEYGQIRRILERIDMVPRQVLIQVMVAEVELTESLQYGVEWWLRNLRFKNGRSSNRAQAGLDTGLVAPGINVSPVATAPADGVASGLNYMVFNSLGDITALFNLLGTSTDVNLLSSPHVLASDGRTARIEVGSEEPVVTQTVATPNTVTTGVTTSNTVQYRPTGILLEVKPTINAAGRVSLNLVQEVSARGTSVIVGGSLYPSFTKRKVSTDVTLEEGKTLVVAGLIQDRGDNNNQGLPGLKDIPVVGALFGTQKNNRDKTELLIAITPYIVRNNEEGDRISATLRENLGELKKRFGDRLSNTQAVVRPPQPAGTPTPAREARPQP